MIAATLLFTVYAGGVTYGHGTVQACAQAQVDADGVELGDGSYWVEPSGAVPGDPMAIRLSAVTATASGGKKTRRSTRTALRPEADQDVDEPTRPGLYAVPDDHGVVVDLRDAPEQLTIGIREGVAELPFVASDEGLLGASLWERAAKRFIDVVVAAVAMVALSPVFVCAALVVKASSSGPVFYAQDRVGCRGRCFRFLKFRTMCRDAHDRRRELEGQNQADGPVFKIRHDPRITKVGRVLRKLSLDELPQLVHVLSGEMSLVGPRPPLPEEVAVYGEWEAQRLLVKPGITGIWQVSGRSDLDFDTWVRMDVAYIRDWSLWLDLRLLARTVPAVLSGRGAY